MKKFLFFLLFPFCLISQNKFKLSQIELHIISCGTGILHYSKTETLPGNAESLIQATKPVVVSPFMSSIKVLLNEKYGIVGGFYYVFNPDKNKSEIPEKIKQANPNLLYANSNSDFTYYTEKAETNFQNNFISISAGGFFRKNLDSKNYLDFRVSAALNKSFHSKINSPAKLINSNQFFTVNYTFNKLFYPGFDIGLDYGHKLKSMNQVGAKLDLQFLKEKISGTYEVKNSLYSSKSEFTSKRSITTIMLTVFLKFGLNQT